jgi:hypothetical protein
MTYLSDADQETVRSIVVSSRRAGPDAVASAVRIHARLLQHDREDERRLVKLLDARRRSIAMRELALRLLEGPS